MYDFADWREFAGTKCEFLINVVTGQLDGGQFGVDLATALPRFRAPNESPASATASTGRKSPPRSGSTQSQAV